MAGDYNKLRSDPEFQKKSPTDQARLLAKAASLEGSPSGGKGYPAITSPTEAAAGIGRTLLDVGKFMFVPPTETDAWIQMALMAPELGLVPKAVGQIGRIGRAVGLMKKARPEAAEFASEAESLASRMRNVPEQTPEMLSHANRVEADVLKMLNKSEQKLLSGPEESAAELAEDIAEKPAAVPPSVKISEKAPKFRRQLEPPSFKRPGLARRLAGNRLLGTPALGAAGGALGSSLQGQGPIPGAERGAIVGGIAGLGSAAASKAGSYFGERKLVDSGVASFGRWLKGKFGNSKLYGPLVGTMKNATDFYREFGAGALEQRLGRRVGELNQVIADQFSNRLFSVPLPDGGTARIPFDRVPEYIRSLEDRAWSSRTGEALARTGGGIPSPGAAGLGARQYQALARGTLDSVAAQLESVEPGVGFFWREARRDYGGIRMLTRAFKKADVFGGHEGVDWPEVQATISDNLPQLRASFGEDADDMLRASLRGAQPPYTDVPSRSGHMRLHPHLAEGALTPSMALPHAYRAVGKTPITVNPPPWLLGPASAQLYEQGQ